MFFPLGGQDIGSGSSCAESLLCVSAVQSEATKSLSLKSKLGSLSEDEDIESHPAEKAKRSRRTTQLVPEYFGLEVIV